MTDTQVDDTQVEETQVEDTQVEDEALKPYARLFEDRQDALLALLRNLVFHFLGILVLIFAILRMRLDRAEASNLSEKDLSSR